MIIEDVPLQKCPKCRRLTEDCAGGLECDWYTSGYKAGYETGMIAGVKLAKDHVSIIGIDRPKNDWRYVNEEKKAALKRHDY